MTPVTELAGVVVVVRDREPLGRALRRLAHKLERAGTFGDLSRRRYHMTPRERRRFKERAAAQRRRRHDEQGARHSVQTSATILSRGGGA